MCVCMCVYVRGINYVVKEIFRLIALVLIED